MTDEQILDIAESVTRQNKRTYSFEMTQEQFLSVARALLAAGASEGQEPVAVIVKCHNMRGDTWFDLKMFRRDIPSGAKLYLHPSAEIAALRERLNAAASLNAVYADEIRDLRERIAGMEKDARVSAFDEAMSRLQDAEEYGAYEVVYKLHKAAKEAKEPK